MVQEKKRLLVDKGGARERWFSLYGNTRSY